MLSGFQFDQTADLSSPGHFRRLATIREALLEDFKRCRAALIQQSFPLQIRVVEMAFASDATHGINVWSVLDVASVRTLFYMGGRSDFMLAIWDSLRHRKLIKLGDWGHGWNPLLGSNHQFELFCVNSDCGIPGLNDLSSIRVPEKTTWGDVRMRGLPPGVIDQSVSYEPEEAPALSSHSSPPGRNDKPDARARAIVQA